MAKVQQKTSLCKKKNSCTCKSCDELGRLKNEIYQITSYLYVYFDPMEDSLNIIKRIEKQIVTNHSIKETYYKTIEGLSDDKKRLLQELEFYEPGKSRVRHLRIV